MSARDALRAHLNGQPPPPDPADALREASDLLGLTDPFVRCVRTIPSMDAPMTATTASGVEVRWERQSDAMERRTFVRPFLAAGLAPPPPAKQMSTEHVYALLVRAATLTAEHDAQDEARDWLEVRADVRGTRGRLHRPRREVPEHPGAGTAEDHHVR